MSEKKVDPATGQACTFEQLSASYKGEYKKAAIKAYWEDDCKPTKGKAKGKAKAKAEPKTKAKAKAKSEPKAKAKAEGKAEAGKVRTGKDGGAGVLGKLTSYAGCVMAEYIWLDANQVPRSKTKVMTARPTKVSDCPIWNYDGSSTEQAEGHNSEINIQPRAIFDDPFRGYPHVMVVTDAYNAWDDQPAIGNTRAACAEIHQKYKKHDAWYGIEQEYTLMKPGKIGEKPTIPYGFNADGSEPAPQGPYYCSAGTGKAVGRTVADEHLDKCLASGVKIAGVNAEVMPGQWEYQVGPCRGMEIGDHMTMARYIMLRVTESNGCVVSWDPKPKDGDWNGAGCHTNFSIKSMREKGGYEVITKVCEAFGKVAAEHIAEYGEGNDKRLTGQHETCSIKDFKFAVADRGASIRIPRDAEKNGRGYMEDRRPAANCDAYRVACRILKTAGEALETNDEPPKAES
jgi:glutamine synthetase